MQANFPRNLCQPEAGYRFGLDALLLASFASRLVAREKARIKVADLGTGCGAALIGLALLHKNADGLGIDCEASLIQAARENAARFGLDKRLEFVMADLETESGQSRVAGYQLVIANPPWLLPAGGRLPKSPLRQRALCATPKTRAAFTSAAAKLLCHHGYFCLILPPGQLCSWLATLPNMGLRQILPIASHADKPAKRLLLQIQKDAKSDPEFCPPLVLHESGDCAKKWTDAALAFCPWLENPS